MLLTDVCELGSGRVYLPIEFCTAQNIYFDQPVYIHCTIEGTQRRFLCGATTRSHQVGSAPSQQHVVLDPTVLCCWPALPHVPQPQFDLSAVIKHIKQGVDVSVQVVKSTVIIASEVQVVVNEDTVHSSWIKSKLQQRLVVEGCLVYHSTTSSCSVTKILPVAAAGTVYRIVSSTLVQLVSTTQIESTRLQDTLDKVTLKAPASVAASGQAAAIPQHRAPGETGAVPGRKAVAAPALTSLAAAAAAAAVDTPVSSRSAVEGCCSSGTASATQDSAKQKTSKKHPRRERRNQHQ
eukprot:jgi/Chrzof1/7710/Cz02g33230.t1